MGRPPGQRGRGLGDACQPTERVTASSCGRALCDEEAAQELMKWAKSPQRSAWSPSPALASATCAAGKLTLPGSCFCLLRSAFCCPESGRDGEAGAGFCRAAQRSLAPRLCTATGSSRLMAAPRTSPGREDAQEHASHSPAAALALTILGGLPWSLSTDSGTFVVCEMRTGRVLIPQARGPREGRLCPKPALPLFLCL